MATCKGEPDAVVLGDASLPPILAGIEAWPCLTAFHCVDSHIHSWQPVYAQAFDLCSISLRDHLPGFQGKILPDECLKWLPPWAPDNMRPRDVDKEWDLLFAGTVNRETTPKRFTFLTELKRHLPSLHVTHGDFRELFPKARVVLNYCERGDLNFRVFEALGTGACLLTPEVGHGQDELFTPGEDMYTYPADDMDALIQQAERLLALDGPCEQAGQNGLAKIDAKHRASHRAREYSDWLRSQSDKYRSRRLAHVADIHDGVLKLLYLHMAEGVANHELRTQYLRLSVATPPLI
ncbi:glycosyltransferase [Desulfovibrio ferrophilus]|uniref:glycosyltransferase family protein n=1 Tax=Desulfovibrio ferrophilus TaxID=241368 RepID=UPI001E5EBAF8|nr:glycosyltransferase [Desulfovibrio ferrophilus]